MNKPITQDFYRAFEDRFRGSREQILLRLSCYQPLLDALKAHVPARQAIDLGCGRGEWLEIITEQGFDARGIDTDGGMLSACHERGLAVEQRDALAVLQEAPENSLAMVSAFHLVEHLPFNAVLELMSLAHRALAPGGVIVMETPNSENIGVGTWNFYLDPTHQRPIPHLLLGFGAEFCGFEFTRILRVNHDPQVASASELGLLDVLCRASPDYAVIGMKTRADGTAGETVFADMLAQASGVSLEQLAQRYDDQYSGAIRTLETDLYTLRAQFDNFQEVEAKLLHQFSNEPSGASELSIEKFLKARQTVADRIDKLERAHGSTSQEITDRVNALHQAVDGLRAELANQRLEEAGLKQQLHDVHNSTSWRITRPLRAVVKSIKRLLGRHDN